MGAKAGIAVIVLIFAILAMPSAYSAAGFGLFNKPPKPQLVLPTGGDGKCIEPTDFMRSQHMVLLTHARDRIVRAGEILPKYHLENCKTCHTKRAEFCDRCHQYAGVKPECFDCHNVP